MAVKEQVSAGARVSERTAKSGRGFPWGSVGRYTAVVVIVFIALAPLYWSIATALKSGIELNASPPTLFPHTFSLENFQSDFALSTFTHDLLNSTIIATVTTILALIIGVLCCLCHCTHKVPRQRLRTGAHVVGDFVTIHRNGWTALCAFHRPYSDLQHVSCPDYPRPRNYLTHYSLVYDFILPRSATRPGRSSSGGWCFQVAYPVVYNCATHGSWGLCGGYSHVHRCL